MTKPASVGDLVKAIGRRNRADFHRFEKNIVRRAFGHITIKTWTIVHFCDTIQPSSQEPRLMMARKPRKRREQIRLRLIEATIRSIVEIGLPDTTVSSIMERAGLSRGMLHLHFGSKDELLEATA